MQNPNVIGHIVAVQGFRVKVELSPETKSAMRATLDGVQTAVAINSYLVFSIGAGQVVLGIIADLEARESYDPATGDDLTLELSKPRRVANIQLLGTIVHGDSGFEFSPGITILPTLDTPAELGPPNILKAVFETPPRRNRPDGYDKEDFDFDLRIGCPTGQPSNAVRASYNDLLSRPLAVVGNTGSGKSYSVSSLVQKAMAALGQAGNEPHVFILDINGEYGRAFGASKHEAARKPDRVYLNGEEFGIPVWFFNAEEVCAWLSAAEQTQEPVLKDWWAIAKTRLDDRRWRAFLNYEDQEIELQSLQAWLQKFGLGRSRGPRVSIIDLSMLSHEVLPYACSVIGRLLLEARERLPAASRYTHPWVLVLEEAHNYARPARSDENRGQRLSRLSFERIAKEGRKFGLSLIVASQRPSEISATIISQCANFISHRLQNPDDIDHFRRIIPLQARRLLDQVTILASGEAIVFGSAFHIPTRVQFDPPNPGPWSQTAAPYHEWRTETTPFPIVDVVRAWGVQSDDCEVRDQASQEVPKENSDFLR